MISGKWRGNVPKRSPCDTESSLDGESDYAIMYQETMTFTGEDPGDISDIVVIADASAISAGSDNSNEDKKYMLFPEAFAIFSLL